MAEGLLVRSFDLRYVLTAVLVAAGGPMTVVELVAALETKDLAIAGRPSKAISDILRSEIRKGRVIRVGWGRYQATANIPRSTLARIKSRVQEIEAEAAAAGLAAPSPPT